MMYVAGKMLAQKWIQFKSWLWEFVFNFVFWLQNELRFDNCVRVVVVAASVNLSDMATRAQ